MTERPSRSISQTRAGVHAGRGFFVVERDVGVGGVEDVADTAREWHAGSGGQEQAVAFVRPWLVIARAEEVVPVSHVPEHCGVFDATQPTTHTAPGVHVGVRVGHHRSGRRSLRRFGLCGVAVCDRADQRVRRISWTARSSWSITSRRRCAVSSSTRWRCTMLASVNPRRRGDA